MKQLAERRTDIFGVEETAIGKKIGEEEIQKPEEKVWLEWILVPSLTSVSYTVLSFRDLGFALLCR